MDEWMNGWMDRVRLLYVDCIRGMYGVCMNYVSRSNVQGSDLLFYRLPETRKHI